MLMIARGVCPQNAGTGDKFRGTNCEMQRGIDTWDITTDEELDPGEGQLFAFPGQGCNPDKGVSFGQSDPNPPNGRLFSIKMYKVDGGTAFDAPINFLIVKGD